MNWEGRERQLWDRGIARERIGDRRVRVRERERELGESMNWKEERTDWGIETKQDKERFGEWREGE